MIPPPPIFKPTFVQMQKNHSFSISNDSSPILTYSNTNTNGNSNNNPEFSYLPNSNYLTCSFMPNEEYDSNNLVKFSPCISPMSKFHDTDLSLNAQNLDIPQQQPQPRKRRRSSNSKSFNKEEIERKKKELKTQHSIIEKKRRIKMNREFEALKFLVPACRLNIINGLNESYKNFENSNSMHKLTILQSTVEYIKYLHFIIRLMKHKVLTSSSSSSSSSKTNNEKGTTANKSIRWLLQKQNDLDFANFDLDLQDYRRIENEFNFEDLFMKIWENNGQMIDINDPLCTEINKLIGDLGVVEEDGSNQQESDFSDDSEVDEEEEEEEDETELDSKQAFHHNKSQKSTQFPMIKYIPYSQSTLTPPITSVTTTTKQTTTNVSLSPTSSGSSTHTKSSSSSPSSNIPDVTTTSTGLIYSRSQSITIGQQSMNTDKKRQTPNVSSSLDSLNEANFALPLPAIKLSSSSTNILSTSPALEPKTNSFGSCNSNSATSLTELNATKGLILLKDDNGTRRTSIESLLN